MLITATITLMIAGAKGRTCSSRINILMSIAMALTLLQMPHATSADQQQWPSPQPEEQQTTTEPTTATTEATTQNITTTATTPPPVASTARAYINGTTISTPHNMATAIAGMAAMPTAATGPSDVAEADMDVHKYCHENLNSFADLCTLVLYATVCAVGLFGNTLVIYVVLRYSKMQTVTNIYILNLAIADECFLIGIPFLLYTMRICSWQFGEYMCKAYMVSTSITQFTSSLFLLIMSADRYVAVCHPIASTRYRTLPIAKLVSGLAWLTSAVLMLPVILFASTVTHVNGVHLTCNIEFPEKYTTHLGVTFTLYTFFLGFALPLCFILCFYYLVIRKLHSVGPMKKSKEKKRSHRKVTRLVLTVITVYILCWLPYWISQVALIHQNPVQHDLTRFEILVFLLLGCLAYSNSTMNPILYAFLSDNFRKSFFKAFTCMTKQEVNAQLQGEQSVFTKQASRRRNTAGTLGAAAAAFDGNGNNNGASKRLLSQKQQQKSGHKTSQDKQGNSSTSTSSCTTSGDKPTITVATTYTDKTLISNSCSNSNLLQTRQLPNGRASLSSLSGENVILVLEEEQNVCALMKHNGRHEDAHCVRQTDV